METTQEAPEATEVLAVDGPDELGGFLEGIEEMSNPFLTNSENPQQDADNIINEMHGLEAAQESAPDAQEEALEAPEVQSERNVLDSLLEPQARPLEDDKKKKNKGLREQLQDRNQMVDQLNAQLQEREELINQIKEEREAIAAERAEAQKALTSRYDVGEYDEVTDPSIKTLDQTLVQTLDEAKLTLSSERSDLLGQHWQQLTSTYGKVLRGEVEASKFREIIDQNFGEESNQAIGQIRELNKLISKRAELATENRTKHFQSVIGSWEDRHKRVKDSLEAIGAAPEEVIKEAPLEVNSIVSYIAQKDEAFAQELRGVRASVASFASDVRPFDIRDEKWRSYVDPSSPHRLTEEGERVRQNEVNMMMQAKENLPQILATSLASAKLLPRLAKRISELEARLGDSQGSTIEPKINTELPVTPATGGEGLNMDDITDEMMENPSLVKNPYM